ncbi:MAG: dTDP-4-dehydrorhamnose 3,5-epimerase [Thalassobaculales bacterium]
MVEVVPLEIPEVKLIRPQQFKDDRGFLSETYNRGALVRDAGIDVDFCQDIHSMSRLAGTVRGLHFQIPPFQQDKLVRVVRGAIYDVAVDIRQGSPHFGKHVGAVLSAENWTQLYIPAGFAHGFCTLEADTEVVYKVSNFYSAAHDRGLLWNDPALRIDWRLGDRPPVLSDKDRRNPVLSALPELFIYRG